MRENTFWIVLWTIVTTIVMSIITAIVFSGHLDNQRDLSMAAKGLQVYKVERCSQTRITTEWHEAGWKEN